MACSDREGMERLRPSERGCMRPGRGSRAAHDRLGDRRRAESAAEARQLRIANRSPVVAGSVRGRRQRPTRRPPQPRAPRSTRARAQATARQRPTRRPRESTSSASSATPPVACGPHARSAAARARARPGRAPASGACGAPAIARVGDRVVGVREPAGLEQRGAEHRQQLAACRVVTLQQRGRTLEQPGARGRVPAQERRVGGRGQASAAALASASSRSPDSRASSARQRAPPRGGSRRVSSRARA